MPSISSCPECHRDLTIPDLDTPGRRLRCPLCDAQFPAERLLADSVSFPPLAVVVDEEADRVLPPVAAPEQTPAEETLETAPAQADVSELPPVVDSEPPAPAEPPDEQWPASAPPSEIAVVPHSTIDDLIASAEDEEGEIDVAIEDDVTVSTGEASSAVEIERPSFHVAAQPSRRKASVWSAIVQLLGMAAGGVLGLAIGYWILLWINPRADFLELRGKLPAWMIPGGRHHSSLRHDEEMSAEAAVPLRSLAGLVDAAELDESKLPGAVQPADFTQTDTAELTENAESADPPPDETAAQPFVGPRGFMAHTSVGLKSALDAATRALRCEHCLTKQPAQPADDDDAPAGASTSDHLPRKMPRCEHCRGTGVGNITASVFERLCELAETATFAQLDDDDLAREAYRNAAQDLMLLVGADRDRGEVIGRLAADRLDDRQRPSNGVIICGSVAQTCNQGGLFTMRIVLSGVARTVTVVSRDAPQPAFSPRDHVLILGSIIDSPANNLAGYEGDEPQVVWGGVPFRLTGP